MSSLLKEPPFTFVLGVLSGVALGYAALKYLDININNNSNDKSTPSSTDTSVSVLSDLYVSQSYILLLHHFYHH